LSYFTEFGKPAFQHITASVHIERIDQKSASYNSQSGEVCVPNKMHAFAGGHEAYL